MKKLPIKTEYIVLGLIIVGLGVAIALRTGNRLRYRLPSLPVLEVEEISRLTVTRASGGLDLEKKDGVWTILPQGYKADESTVSNLARAVAEAELTTLVSEAESFARYGLDEGTRMAVTAYTAQTKARELEVGKEDTGGRTSFVLVPGDRRVYTTRQNFRRLFDVTADSLRDMVVMSFPQADIAEITVRRGSETLILTRTTSTADPPVTAWKNASGEAWDGEVVDRMFSTLTRLRAQRYGEVGETLGAEEVSVALKAVDGSTHTLAIHEKKDTQYRATSSQSDYPFYLAEYQRTDVISIFDGKAAPTG